MGESDEKRAEFIRVQSPREKAMLVCEWTLYCYEQARTVAIHVAGRGQAEKLDKLLWSFRQESFLPHVIAAEADEPIIEPIRIYCADDGWGQEDVLIETAGGEPTERFREFDHLYDFAEVYDDQLRELSRRRFKACQQAGYKMRFIDRE
jgi:DNA polymerase-3 subunit chi